MANLIAESGVILGSDGQNMRCASPDYPGCYLLSDIFKQLNDVNLSSPSSPFILMNWKGSFMDIALCSADH